MLIPGASLILLLVVVLMCPKSECKSLPSIDKSLSVAQIVPGRIKRPVDLEAVRKGLEESKNSPKLLCRVTAKPSRRTPCGGNGLYMVEWLPIDNGQKAVIELFDQLVRFRGDTFSKYHGWQDD